MYVCLFELISGKIQSFVEGNFLQLQIYWESFANLNLSEVPEYSFSALLSAVGGAVSLYLGLSLVTMFEVIEFIVRLALMPGKAKK